jgi:hypothetical protein
MISKTVKGFSQFGDAVDWVRRNMQKGLEAGPVVITLGREERSSKQNDKAWPMYRDFEPILFNGRHWKAEQWKNFLMSAFNQEMPAIGLLGEPVSMTRSTSSLSKKRFAEFIEFIYAEGSNRGVRWSEPALEFYESII